jgi:NAD(P)-dependent dehydrogenase (short-subunit alcohol dehydrogenase family)
MSFDLELNGRRALVTGGTKGIGAAVVAILRDAGVKVVTTSSRPVPAPSPEPNMSSTAALCRLFEIRAEVL